MFAVILILFYEASATISHYKLEEDYDPWRIFGSFDSSTMENYIKSLEHQIFMQKYVMGYWP